MTDAEVKQARKPEESVASFQARARAWLAGNMPRLREGWNLIREDDDRASQSRELQRRLWDGGFAGICYPREYGGLGLPVEYHESNVGHQIDLAHIPAARRWLSDRLPAT